MAGQFMGSDGDLETAYVTDYAMIDQFAMTGSLWGVGLNATYGQLGDNTVTNRSSPVQTVAGGTNWKQVASGPYISAAVKTDGSLWTWGINNAGSLGDNTLVTKSSPVQTISGGTNWVQVSVGNRCVAAVKTNGSLWLWGNNTNGQIGDNSILTRSSPVQTVAAGTNWQEVAFATSTAAALKTNGTLWLWGLNGYGQLGDNSTSNKSSPVQTVSGGTNWSSIFGGRNHFAGLKTDGTLWLWGYNNYGQLGDNSIANKSSPVQTIASGTGWKQLSGGEFHTLAIKTDGTLWLWGRNNYGQLGNNGTTNYSSPIQTVAGGTNWKQAAAGGHHNSAVKTDGTLWLWGRNDSAQLGTNDVNPRSSPVQSVAGGNNWKNTNASLYVSFATYFYDAGNLYPNA